MPSAGHLAIGSSSWDRMSRSAGGTLNRATSLPRLVTITVSSSMKSTPWGRCRAGDDSSTPPVNAIRVAPRDDAMSISKTTMRLR